MNTFELVIVPVKHYALLQTLKEIVPRIGAAEFLLLTQNWGDTEEIDSILPRPRYIYSAAKAGRTLPGHPRAALKAIDIGSPAVGSSWFANPVARPLRKPKDRQQRVWLMFGS
jgi:ketopantoate reductase